MIWLPTFIRLRNVVIIILVANTPLCPSSSPLVFLVIPSPLSLCESTVSIWRKNTRFPGGADSRVHLQRRRPAIDPWVGQIPGEGNWQATPVFLPGKSHERRSMTGDSPCGGRVGHNWATSLSRWNLSLSNIHPKYSIKMWSVELPLSVVIPAMVFACYVPMGNHS